MSYPFQEIIKAAAKAEFIPEALLAALIHVESYFDPAAESKAGAKGLGQLMPRTAVMLGVTNPADPQQNVFAAARYLRMMADRYAGNPELALAAYNAGPGRIGLPAKPRSMWPEETRNYVDRVAVNYLKYAGLTPRPGQYTSAT